LHDVGAEVVGRELPRDAPLLEQRLIDARRVVLEEHDQEVVAAELVDGAAGEVADPGRQRDGRRVQHRVGRLGGRGGLALHTGVGRRDLPRRRTPEHSALPPGGERHLDAVGGELGHECECPSGGSLLGNV
jgi:hypothetical protein